MQAGEALRPPGSPVWGWGWTPPALPCFWPCRAFAALLSWDCQPGVPAELHPHSHPSFWGSGGHYPHFPSLPHPAGSRLSWLPAMPSQWRRGPVCYQSECPAGCREGETDLEVVWYGVNEALCPFKWSLSWDKEMGDREAYLPGS